MSSQKDGAEGYLFFVPWDGGYTHPPFRTWEGHAGNTEEEGKEQAEEGEETLVIMAHGR